MLLTIGIAWLNPKHACGTYLFISSPLAGLPGTELKKSDALCCHLISGKCFDINVLSHAPKRLLPIRRSGTTSETQGTHDDAAPAELLAVFVVGDGRQCLRLASHPSHLGTFLSPRTNSHRMSHRIRSPHFLIVPLSPCVFKSS